MLKMIKFLTYVLYFSNKDHYANMNLPFKLSLNGNKNKMNLPLYM